MKLQHLEELTNAMRPPTKQPTFSVDDLRPLLTEEIGYQIISQRTAGFVLMGFVVGLFGIGLLLRRSAHPERVGWVGPLLAGVATVAFIVLGMQSRQAVPPTTAAVQIVDAVPGSGEASVSGLFAMYRPMSGDVPLATTQLGKLDLDMSGLDGQTRRRVQTDIGRWHWDQLSMPAGVRMGPFQLSTKPGGLRATGQFTANGLEGTIQAQGFQELADAMIVTANREPIGVHFQGERFRAGREEELGLGQYVTSTVLTDQQQRRQTIYQKILTPPMPEYLEDRTTLLVWAKSNEVPFSTGEQTRHVVSTLLQLPLELERTPPNSKVFIPRSFIRFRRVLGGYFLQPRLEDSSPVNMETRFQLPASVLPMTIEKVVLTARVRAPGRTLTISGLDGKTPTELSKTDSPAEPVRVEITDAKFLQLDDQGGLRLNVAIGRSGTLGGIGDADSRWKIESLALEVTGQTK